MKLRRQEILSISLAIFFASGATLFGEVELREEKESVAIRIDGEEFTDYNFGKSENFPYFYPLREPGGANVTRHYPMEDGHEGELQDHPHHKSLWFVHGDVNGVDFWHQKGRVVQSKIVSLESGKDKGTLKTENEWRDKKGNIVCTDSRKYVFRGDEGSRSIDIEIALKASHGEVVLGDTKEGTMAVRVAPTMRLQGKVAKGHILMNTGVKDGKAWGKRAAWCDYYGPLQGETVGVAIFDSPNNLRHPTWWHARDYGLCTANPFGISYYDNKPRGTGDFKLDAGETLKLEYRVFIHKGEMSRDELQNEYEEWSKKTKSIAESDWAGWHRPIKNNVFTPDHGNNHDAILFVEPDLEYPYHLIVSGQTSHAYLWRAKEFSWDSSDWDLVSEQYKIAGHYEYDDGVKVDDTYYIYEEGNVYTYSGPLEKSSGQWKKSGTFPKKQCDDIGVYYEDGVFHIFGEYGNFPHGPDGTSLSHFTSKSGVGDWKLENEKAVDPNPDGGNAYGVGDATIARIEGKYYIFCDLETKDKPYRVIGWQSDSIYGPFQYIGKVIEPREDETDHWDNYRIQDPDIAYIPDLQRYVMVCNMKDHDGEPGYPGDFSYPVPHLKKGQTRVVGFFYSDSKLE